MKPAMEPDDLPRRALLQLIASAFGAAALSWDWGAIAEAAHQAHATPPPSGDRTPTFFTPAEAADVEAVTAQIIPTDDTPGAREAGVVHFIDRALATFLSPLAADYRTQLVGFQAGYLAGHPEARSFASLTPAQQIAHLTEVERTPFFDTTRLLTLLGMFSMPEYGGNRDGVGWKLIGFDDQHAFQSPFGHYDRDYPGFVVDPSGTP